MKTTNKRLCTTFLALAVSMVYIQCRQPFVLPLSTTHTNYLVVEGVITNSPSFKLSRTTKLSDTVNSYPELGATVSIESRTSGGGSGPTAALADTGGGHYISAGTLALDQASTYRLKIVTSNGKVYLSDYVPVKNSPPIDSLNFEVKSDGVQVYSATHDPANNTRYYRWDYNETWIIHSKYASSFKHVQIPQDTIVARPNDEQIFTCWNSDVSSSIYLNSSAKLSQDVIVHNPVGFVSSSSEKLISEYSVQVNQYALTSDAFDYWQNLKKNTEQLGSIFDAQPSEIKGNIHSASDPSETVLGYISAGTPSQARLFIGNSSLPYFWFQQVKLPYDDCLLGSVYYNDPKDNNLNTVTELYGGALIPTNAIFLIIPPKGLVLIGYYESTSYCVDCRFRGSNLRPSFWIDKF